MSTPGLMARAVADLVGGRLSGPDVRLDQVRSLERATADAIAMCVSRQYADAMAASAAGAVLVPGDLADHPGPDTRIVVSDPAAAMLRVIAALYPVASGPPSIAATARIGTGATVGDSASIGEYAVIGNGVRIGARAQVGIHVVIEEHVVIGDDVRLDAHVVVHGGAVLGDRVHCKAGAVIGGPGFGYLPRDGGHARIPHIGGCIIEDDVDIGANSCVDRGSLDDTRVGRGTKIDNLVHVAHNVQIGPECLLMSGVGVAGSTRLGARVILAGQAGCADHITVGDGARIAARAGVIGDVPAGATMSGYPARPHREFLRGIASMYRLAPHTNALVALVDPVDGDADA